MTGQSRCRRPGSGEGTRPVGLSLAASWAALALVALSLAACSGTTRSAPPLGIRTPHPPREAGLVGRVFWFGDSEGSLFEVVLDTATTSAGSVGSLTLSGTATNLLSEPARFDAEGELRLGRLRRPVSGGSAGSIGGGRSGAVRFVAQGVPPSADLAAAVVVFGPAGTNQAVVPLGGERPVVSTGPRVGFAGNATLSVGSGAQLRVTRSLLYPRFVSGRAGQYRVWMSIDLRLDASSDPNRIVLLHPSLTSPDGATRSLGDQYSTAPDGTYVETTVINPPVQGHYALSTIELSSGTTATFGFDVR